MLPSAPPPPPAPTTELHYTVQEASFEHSVSPKIEEIIKLTPRLLFGTVNFFEYNETKHAIVLTPAFHFLLKYLVQIHELNPDVLKATTLSELNNLLQKPQGFEGGLLRKEGTERWELKDSLLRIKFRPRLETLFEQIGLLKTYAPSLPLTVDHCVLFGANCTRMEKRIKDTVAYLDNNLEVNSYIYLLGSNRKLIPDELELITLKREALSDSQRNYWKKHFEDPANQTEADGFLFLWKALVPEALQKKYRDKLILIQSTRLQESCGQASPRPNTESTVLDWNAYYQEGKKQSVFALVEHPFSRLIDQFQTTVLTKGKKASRDLLIERIMNTTFSFAVTDAPLVPLVSITLDEIARNVYRMTDTLHYLESLER